jgi:ABC-2 type transporter
MLLQKGGEVAFCGELGPECCHLVDYFESLGVRKIDRGENPASWMLQVVNSDMFVDFAEEYKESHSYYRLKDSLSDINDNAEPKQRVYFKKEFAARRHQRRVLVNERLRTIYWRSPAYNRLRMVIYLAIALVLGSVFLPETWAIDSYSETEMHSLLSTVFISFIFTGVLAINSVLPVMLKIRDSFYRHRQAGMLDDVSFALGLGVAEKWFIVVSSFLFCVVFLPCAELNLDPGRAISFAGIFCFNTAIYSYFGQAFMCLVSGMPQAQILASIFIGLNNFFSGLIVRPQHIYPPFNIAFWFTPGHFVYEGLVVSLFYNETTPVVATPGSNFYENLGCSPDMEGECVGTVWGYVDTFFGGKYQREHLYYDAMVLGFYLTLARLVTYFALKHFTFTA